MTRNPDPSKIKVQLNTPITYEFMDHLDQLSKQKRISKAQLVRDALENAYPLPVAGVREQTREAGATR